MEIKQINSQQPNFKAHYEADTVKDNEVQVDEVQSRHEQGPWKLWGELQRVATPSKAQAFAAAFVAEHGFENYESITDKGNGAFEIVWSGENPFHLNSYALENIGFRPGEWEYENEYLKCRYWRLEVRTSSLVKLTINEDIWNPWWDNEGSAWWSRTIPVSGEGLQRLFSGFYNR